MTTNIKLTNKQYPEDVATYTNISGYTGQTPNTHDFNVIVEIGTNPGGEQITTTVARSFQKSEWDIELIEAEEPPLPEPPPEE